MATIPIEVIVQDKEIPAPETNTEETTAGTPDTGVGLVDNNNTTTNGMNGVFSSSANTIILPAILLTLTLITLVVLFIRKHLRHNSISTKTSRKEKLVAAATSTMAVIAATVLVGQLFMSVTSAVSEDANNTNTEDKITITIDKAETLEANVEDTAYATVTTSFGYEILLAMSSNTANLYLDGDETSEYYIAPTESAKLDTNTWGYSLEESEDYEKVPLADDAILITKGTETIKDEEFNIYYGVKVSEDLPAGAYKGEIEYILNDTGFPYALRTMQDMTTEICEAIPTPNAFKADGETIENIVPTATIKDARDNKTYTIVKLADGNCWMTQNLDLQKEDLLAGVTLDNTNTNNPASGFELPDSQTSGNESWGPSNDETAINTAHVYDTAGNGETYKNCLRTQYGSCIEEGDIIPSESLGNLYNWYAATAGTGTYSTGSEGSSYEATGSICPAGWRLPNSSNDNEPTDWSELFYEYGILESATSINYDSEKINNAYEAPFLLIRSGGYRDNGIISVGRIGNITSSLAIDNSTLRSFNFDVGYENNSFNPWSYQNYKYWGRSIRCIAE